MILMDVERYVFYGLLLLMCLHFLSVQALLAGLDSKDWVLVCESLNDVRRISIFHKESMFNML